MERSKIKISLDLIRNSKYRKYIFIFTAVLVLAVFSFYFVNNDEKYYNGTIAKITAVSQQSSDTTDANGNSDKMISQQIKAVIINGKHKNEEINFQNKTSFSNANDIYLKVNDEVFVSLNEGTSHNITSVQIIDFKRDTYIYYIVILFLLCAVLIGGLKGIRSLVSLGINILITLTVVSFYLKGCNLLITASLASLLYIVTSMFLVSGINKKSYSAILGTVAGTFVSMLIAFFVIKYTNGRGIHYEEMEFLTHPPEQIFFSEILIGTLGAIMDIAISMSSSIKEIYDGNPGIERKALMKSGMEIGKDIMGTMANTLVFAFVSGSIPILLIWIKNSFPISYIISINFSLEIIRALTGSIGIVLSIPITLYISVIILKKNKMGEY